LRLGSGLSERWSGKKIVRVALMLGALYLLPSSTVGWAAEGSAGALASSRIPADRLQQYSDLAVTWMQEYLRVDTTNPPGNEMRGVAFYKRILDQEGIENRVFEYAPGRGDLWARLPRNSGSSDGDQTPHPVAQDATRVGHPHDRRLLSLLCSHPCGHC
jgi:hypothetical protein